ncbi:MAG TPA: YbaB/EbfC family nucleoid-associated protein [Acidimicrobiales bacterium]|jgi:hypothetical protein|nr:YbaB/EbfC family nucleoid-associated protein [Acidimicrobiales bacterium]|tara:strand:+ start:308 stop:628 length:321 start_codon:yes stop_codon:yes gene_type:complete
MSENLANEQRLLQMQDLQDQLIEQRQAISATPVEGLAGGGAIKVSVRADGTVLGVAIDADAVNSGEVGLLEDLVAAAFRDALKECGNTQAVAIARLNPLTLPGQGG